MMISKRLAYFISFLCVFSLIRNPIYGMRKTNLLFGVNNDKRKTTLQKRIERLRRKVKEERRKKEEAERKRLEQIRRRQEITSRLAEEERRRQEAERRRIAEEERLRREEEERRRREEEEERREVEEIRRLWVTETLRRAEEEHLRKEEERLCREEEELLRMEEEKELRAQEKKRLLLEEKVQLRTEEERRHQEVEARRKIEEEQQRNFEEALHELEKLFQIFIQDASFQGLMQIYQGAKQICSSIPGVEPMRGFVQNIQIFAHQRIEKIKALAKDDFEILKSCLQNLEEQPENIVKKLVADLNNLLNHPGVEPIRDEVQSELQKVEQRLQQISNISDKPNPFQLAEDLFGILTRTLDELNQIGEKVKLLKEDEG